MLDYRNARARAEAQLGRAEQRGYDDRRRTSVPESDDAEPSPPDGSGSADDNASGTDDARSASDAAGRANKVVETGAHSAKAAHTDVASATADTASKPPSAGADLRPERPDSNAELTEPTLPELVEAGQRSADQLNDRPDLSNRIRQPREGDVNYIVDDPDDLARTITDIDLIKGGTLWEVKRVTGGDPRMDTETWIDEHVHTKLDRYVDARHYLDAYKTAPIGLLFINSSTTAAFRARVESAVHDWEGRNDGEVIKVRWAK